MMSVSMCKSRQGKSGLFIFQGDTDFQRDIFLQILFFVLLFTSFLKKTVLYDLFPFINYADELCLLTLLPNVIIGLRSALKNKFLKYALFCFVLYLATSVGCAFSFGVCVGQILFQAVLDIKPLLICLALISICDTERFLNYSFILMKIFIVMSLLLGIFQFISPSFYDVVFPCGAHHGIFMRSDGSTLPRMAGAFWFVGECAVFSGTAVILFAHNYFSYRSKSSLLWLTCSVAVLLMTFSRLEIVGTLCGLIFSFFVCYRTQVKFERLFVCVFLCLAAGGVAFVMTPYLSGVWDFMGGGGLEVDMAPRLLMYVYSFVLAKMYFPFGSGMGTYGGYGAEVFDSAVYDDLGMSSFAWVQNNYAMTDTFWPHILGESGVLGTIFYLGFLGFILWGMVRASWRSRVGHSFVSEKDIAFKSILLLRAGVGCFAILLVNSIASSNLNDPLSLFLGVLSLSLANLRIGRVVDCTTNT